MVTPRLRLQYWWPGLGVVGGFVIGIGMAGPGFGVLARKAFVLLLGKSSYCLFYFSYRHHTAPSNTPLALGPIGALRVLALVCLLRNINADSKKIGHVVSQLLT